MLTDNQIMLRLLLAGVLGGLIGLERELHGRVAGLRTHILVCLGSCLIMLTSLYTFEVYAGRANLDPTRIAAGIVTGIGFLGAGTIIRSGASIRGLTTAASLWIVSGMGMAIGCGFFVAANATTLLTLVSLFILTRFETRFVRKDWYKTLLVHANTVLKPIEEIKAVLKNHNCQLRDFEITKSETGSGRMILINVRLMTKADDNKIISDISAIDEIKLVKWI